MRRRPRPWVTRAPKMGHTRTKPGTALGGCLLVAFKGLNLQTMHLRHCQWLRYFGLSFMSKNAKKVRRNSTQWLHPTISLRYGNPKEVQVQISIRSGNRLQAWSVSVSDVSAPFKLQLQNRSHRATCRKVTSPQNWNIHLQIKLLLFYRGHLWKSSSIALVQMPILVNPIVCLYAHARQRIVSCNKQTISYCTVSYYIQSYIISDHVVSYVFD